MADPPNLLPRSSGRIDLDVWWKREVAKGVAQADAGKLVPAEQVMKRARRLQTPRSKERGAFVSRK